MPPRKRRRAVSAPYRSAATVAPPSPEWRLPPDILLEITARSDTATLIRCAAACKSLRREILHPDFIRRVCDESTLMLGLLYNTTFHLLHPLTPATVSLAADHLAPFLSRTATTDGLLEQYSPLTSRGGLILLERHRSIDSSEYQSDMCVYDPVTNARAFLPLPTSVRDAHYELQLRGKQDRHLHHGHLDHLHSHVVLTAADGIGCAFQVIAADIVTGTQASFPFRLQTVSSSDAGKWGPVVYVRNPGPPGSMPVERDNGAVFVDGVVHWLMLLSTHVLTYDVGTNKAGLIPLPVDRLPVNWRPSESCLGSSPDGKNLWLLTVDGFRVSVLSLSPRSVEGGGWIPHRDVDMESLLNPWEWEEGNWVELESSGDQRSGAVLMRLHTSCGKEELLVLDTETMETTRIGEISGFPFEVHLSSRLTAMKIFS